MCIRDRSYSDRQYNRLEGKERQKAWEQGRCLGCGSSEHLIANCPTLKKAFKKFTKKWTQPPKHTSTRAQYGSTTKKKFKELKTKDSDDESETDQKEEDSEKSDTSSDSGVVTTDSESENSSAESQG